MVSLPAPLERIEPLLGYPPLTDPRHRVLNKRQASFYSAWQNYDAHVASFP
jgi:hypothetical protein